MFQLLDIRKCLEWFAPLVGATVAIIWAIRMPREPMQVLDTISLAGLISVLIVVLVGETPIFHALWRISFIQNHLFPYIPGTYEGTISSNWSVISALRAAATGSGGVLDSNLHVDQIGSFDKAVTVEVKASLFRVSMKLKPKDAYTDSQTVWLRPVREDEAGHPRLYYMYKSFAQKPKPTDVNVHFGAAYVDVINDSGKLTLRGVYWTERDWSHGNNTAGALNAVKV